MITNPIGIILFLLGIEVFVLYISSQNRVAVTDLSLGEGSKKGSFLKRIIKIIAVE